MNETQTFDQGIVRATAAEGGPSEAEQADVKAWFRRIKEAREFDKSARRRYAVDRAYARGDRGKYEINVPVAPSYVDILTAMLYAKDPDLDVQPSDATTPPPMADILEIAKVKVQADPRAQLQIQQAGQAAAQKAQEAAVQQIGAALLPALTGGGQEGGGAPAMPPGPPPDPNAAYQVGAQAKLDELTKAAAKELMAPYRQRLSDAKQFAQTLSSVIPYLWKMGKLKKSARPLVRSALTVSLGWIKATWQERTAPDPIMQTQLNDLQDNLRRLDADQQELASGEACNPDELRAQIQREIEGIAGKIERVVARGMVFDFVKAEDITVSTAVPSMEQYLDAPWISHRAFIPYEEAKAAFPGIDPEKLKGAARYYPREPSVADPSKRDAGSVQELSDEDADTFRSGASLRGDNSGEGSLHIEEVWDKNAGNIVTIIEGLDQYARKPYSPQPATTRFYGLFQYAPLQVDGERHPESLIKRSETQLDDMNRLSSNRSEHRRRTLPKTVFNGTQMTPQDAERIAGATTQEMVRIDPVNPQADMRTMIVPVAYAAIDETLYDDSQTRAQLEMTWGVQEALASSIQTPKTATEAEIQQHGTEARTDFKRDALDDMLDELAEYTSEVALARLTWEDVKRIAGPWAFWPEAVSAEDLATLCNVKIKAGSSGKPNTAARQQAMAQVFPVLQQMITTIGQLRGSAPEAVADCLEQLAGEMLNLAGDRLDPERFLPSAPDTNSAPAAQPQPAPMAAPAATGAMA